MTEQPTLPAAPPLRVLIIGVRDYDQPWAPTAEGALHDAIGWWRYAVLMLGADPAEVRVLTSPQLTPAELAALATRDDPSLAATILAQAQATQLGSANSALASESVSWLLQHPDQKLLTFSGHGIANPDVLGELGRRPRPSDFWFACADHALRDPEAYRDELLGATGDGVISLERVRSPTSTLRAEAYMAAVGAAQTDKLTPTAPAPLQGGLTAQVGGVEPVDEKTLEEVVLDDLTLIIDACFSTPVLRDAQASSVGPGPLHEAMAGGGRGLFACDVNGACHTIAPGSLARGAWSWALQAVLSRWDVGLHPATGYAYSTISHDELKHRARDLLDTLGVPQRPLLTGDRRVDQLALLAPSALLAVGSPKLAVPEPDLPLPRLQIKPVPFRPAWKIELHVTDLSSGVTTTTTFAWLLNPASSITVQSGGNSTTYLAAQEYWQVNRAALAAMQNSWNDSGASCKLVFTALGYWSSATTSAWIINTFQPAFGSSAQLYVTPAALSFGAGSTTPNQSGANSPPFLAGWKSGPTAVDRGLQLVLDLTATPPLLSEQRWFWAAFSKPGASDWFFDPTTTTPQDAPQVSALPTYSGGPLVRKWYTHIG